MGYGGSAAAMVDCHGVQVHTRCWDHPRPSAVALVSHGASEHSGRYDRLGKALQAAGFAAYALDHRGHGRTADVTGPGRMGPPGGEALLHDLDDLRARAEHQHPGVPVVLIGHSLGAVIALAYATTHPSALRGLALSGFPASLAGAAGFRDGFQAAITAGLADEPMPSFAAYNEQFEPARTPYDWLSRDEAEVDAYVADPLCGDELPLTYGFCAELFSALTPAIAADALSRLSCPALLLTGDQDPAAANGAHARELADALTAAGVQVEERTYAGARHEVFNETNRDDVVGDLLAWLQREVAG